MSQAITNQYLIDLYAFPFRDSKWISKFLVGTLLTTLTFPLIIVPSIFLYGYSIRIMRRIIHEGGEPFLPEWGDWGGLIKDGLKLTIVASMMFLPLLIVFASNGAIFFGLTLLQPGETGAGGSAGGQAILPFWLPLGVLFVLGANGIM